MPCSILLGIGITEITDEPWLNTLVATLVDKLKNEAKVI